MRCPWAKQRHSMPLFEIGLKVRVTKTLIQNEANCKTFLVKISFISMKIRNHFRISYFAHSLAFEVGDNSVMVYDDG